MATGKTTRLDYPTLTPGGRSPVGDGGYSTLKPPRKELEVEPTRVPPSDGSEHWTAPRSEPEVHETAKQTEEVPQTVVSESKARRIRQEKERLASDRWLVRNGHTATYAALFLFTAMVLFRPYELVPGLGFMAATTVYFALVTIILYVPSQLVTEGNLSMLTTEVKAVLALTVIALVTMPLARNPGMAWETFSDTYIKAVVIFIILINVVRTRARLMGLLWLALGIGVYLSVQTTRLYLAGEFSVEGYRVAVSETKGIFGNPNDMAIHFVTMVPIVLALGVASKTFFMRLIYFSMLGLFVAATMFTFSRGGFLGLMAVAAVLLWKLGRKHRLNVTIGGLIAGAGFLAVAPGNYGLRMISIFIPSLDPVGSATARREGLITSLLVTVRNPWGVGIGNSPTFGAHNLQTHNAYTQVSAELGILGLIAYLVLMVSPFRKLGAIERTIHRAGETNWFYYMSIGLQASIVGYLVTSFFASVAYNWFIYYLIAYAVAFRRIYAIENGLAEDLKADPIWDRSAVAST